MPTKKNFLGGQQNYNKKTGEYEPSLVGRNGQVIKDADGDGKVNEGKKKTTHTWKSGRQSEIEYVDKAPKGYKEVEGALTAPNGYRWYSNGKSYFDKDRDTVLVKDENWFGDEKDFNEPGELESQREEKDFNLDPSVAAMNMSDEEFSEHLQNEKGWKKDEAENFTELTKQPKGEFKLDKQKYPDVEKTPYGYVYNVNGTSITDLGGEAKKLGFGYDPNKQYGFSVARDGEEQVYESFEDAYNSIKQKRFDEIGDLYPNEITREEYRQRMNEEANRFPKGTSKEYTDKVNKQYESAIKILGDAGIKTDFKNFEDISKAQKEIISKWNETHDGAKYKPLYDALEVVEDKMYNDSYIRLAPYGY